MRPPPPVQTAHLLCVEVPTDVVGSLMHVATFRGALCSFNDLTVWLFPALVPTLALEHKFFLFLRLASEDFG